MNALFKAVSQHFNLFLDGFGPGQSYFIFVFEGQFKPFLCGLVGVYLDLSLAALTQVHLGLRLRSDS